MSGGAARAAGGTALLAALLAACWGCAGPAALGGPGADPALRALAARGWTLASPARTFSPDTLYEEIDGEAALYLPYDFRSLKIAVLSRKDRPAVEVRVGLFRHGSARDAWGIYSLRRFPGQRFAAVGPSEAIVSDASVEFARGATFVQVGQGSAAATRADLLDVAQGLSDALEGTGGPPPEAAVVKIAAAVPATTVYQKRAILGYEALAPGYEARFSAGDVSGTVFFLEPAGAAGGSSPDALARALPGFETVSPGLYRAELATATLWLVSENGLYAGAAGSRLTRGQAEPVLAELRNNLAAYARARGESR